MRRPTLLQRKFALGLLGRKASLVAPPEKRDQSGFDDVDSYFSPQKETEPAKENKSDWTVTKTPLKTKSASRLQEQSSTFPTTTKEEEYEEYTMPIMEDDYDYATEAPQQPEEQQEEDEEEEISFGAKVITSPLSAQNNEKTASIAEDKSPVATRAKVNKSSRMPKKSLVSPRLLAESGTEVDEEGIRRSKRNRIQPLEYWKNEKVVYGRRQSSGSPRNNLCIVGLPVIVDIIKAPDTPAADKKKRKHRKAKRTSSAPEAAGYQQTGLEISGIVRNPEGQEEGETLLAISGEKIKGEAVPGADFKIHTVFVEGEFMSAGMLLFPKPGVSKPSRNSSRHALAFHVIKGSFEVAVNRSSFVAGPGASFFVPRNNQYAIKNVGTGSGRLFFCHCRQ